MQPVVERRARDADVLALLEAEGRGRHEAAVLDTDAPRALVGDEPVAQRQKHLLEHLCAYRLSVMTAASSGLRVLTPQSMSMETVSVLVFWS